jgi:hypothetical protein
MTPIKVKAIVSGRAKKLTEKHQRCDICTQYEFLIYLQRIHQQKK